MWWFSDKKRGNGDSFHNIHLFSKIKDIEGNIKSSFFNIKKDIQKINDFIDHHDNKINHLKERVIFLEKALKDMSGAKSPSNYSQRLIDYDFEDDDLEEKSASSIMISPIKWEDLTNIQQSIFWRLGLLQTESNQNVVAMKQLSEELYPEKKYNDVRSMMSDYINLLSEYGLVKKIRRGRQIFLSVTEKGTEFFDKNKKKKLLKVINKH
ncbi:hypothetical protein HYX16_05450 [Candidatus Woesearchaeota archaeon]|nr:hypothetical protein [Candidatus Woesearchaeota archaeon]